MDDLLELRSEIHRDYPRGTLTTLARPGVEVVTLPRDFFSGEIISTINGGPHDGEHFTAPEGFTQKMMHRKTVRLARNKK